MKKAKKFPRITADALSGKKVTIPDDVSGEMTLIGVAFVREAQGMLDSWMEYFQDLCKGKDIYELPMIDGVFWKILSGFIDGGMRAGIPEEKHDYVVTYYGDTSEFRKELGMDDKNLAYIFLIDGDGYILFQGSGYPNEEEKKELLKVVKKSCEVD
ncbi:MAG: hypothetical protein R6U61_07075 [Thermoplasmata archaeon]